MEETNRPSADATQPDEQHEPDPNNGRKKELRVRVCTWNVGGVTPGDTDLSAFIFGDTGDEIADILVFSFQELATLDSAVNNFIASLVTGEKLRLKMNICHGNRT